MTIIARVKDKNEGLCENPGGDGGSMKGSVKILVAPAAGGSNVCGAEIERFYGKTEVAVATAAVAAGGSGDVTGICGGGCGGVRVMAAAMEAAAAAVAAAAAAAEAAVAATTPSPSV